ncbi:Protein SYM1 [Galdieria sulphuraria]|uniref:Peroxisomal membrane MPV17/PMP22-like protein n=1 Tax=Galdieria sulphuraria TaxID=130081 RepID=M2WRS1_GALSU|nr:peroxisomal membrane MPV17/PMP22-like protein [Galdieria sulphuraria]EME26530.1 peroxisomal membrane MPV17/PMP22-like protein [Galdieria sulphuraria]GJD07203.1 Protein SYM1 [Galdieria sulphuraria]|eukprot:XP_005703050.1 peroxisomal membrane MPV17/PMP22-like protein [Galdieria sulphuraria]
MLQRLRHHVGRLWYRYNRALATRPLPVKVVTSTVGLALGDVIAQLPLMYEGERWDVLRTLRFSSFGLVVHGPLSHVWYQFLDKHILATAPKSFRAVVAKTMMDQLLWAPVFTSVFFAYLKAAQGNWGDIIPEIRHKLWPTLKVNWLVWPAAHIFNFRFVPDSQRVLYVNIIALGYNAFLSSMAATKKVSDPLQVIARQRETQ